MDEPGRLRTQSPDTARSAERVLLDLQRKKSVTQKLDQVRSLSCLMMGLSRRAIARARRPSSEIEANLLFVELHYGAQLADRLKQYLQKSQNGRS
jgi:hypothetical protein